MRIRDRVSVGASKKAEEGSHNAGMIPPGLMVAALDPDRRKKLNAYMRHIAPQWPELLCIVDQIAAASPQFCFICTSVCQSV